MTDIMVIGARGIPDMEGGAEKNAEMLFPQFADAGYTVELVGLKRYLSTRLFRGVEVTGLPTINILKTDKIIYNFLALFYAVFKRPKIVHLQCLNSALFLVFYKLAGLKVVMRYGSSDYEFAKWGFVERLVLRICEYQLRFADHVITVSRKFEASLRARHGLTDISVIPNGIDRTEVTDEARDFHAKLGLTDTRYILSVGRVTSDKSFETLVDAVRSLEDKSVQLIVAGGGEVGYAEKFLVHPDSRIRFIGRIERRLLSALYANCSVYVNSSRHEGLSNAVLEALSYACPIIISDIEANVEMGLPNENYFPVGNVSALTQKLSDALAAPEAFLCDSEAFHDWSGVYQKTLQVYQFVRPTVFKPNAESRTRGSNMAQKTKMHGVRNASVE